MCGLIGIVRPRESDGCVPALMDGLKRLEPRGYDSAGIATIANGQVVVCRESGKLERLAARLTETKIEGATGAGHTRWATHGGATRRNAHPHRVGAVTVFHNGIVRNFLALRRELRRLGIRWTTQTDTEIVAILVNREIEEGSIPLNAVRRVMKRIEGRNSFIFMFAGFDSYLIAAHMGSPLVLGRGKGEMLVASQSLAITPFTNMTERLQYGDIAVLTPSRAELSDVEGRPIPAGRRKIRVHQQSEANVTKGGFSHFMLKEIFEQPDVLRQLFNRYFERSGRWRQFPSLPFDPKAVTNIELIASGSSFHAAMLGELFIGEYGGVPVHAYSAADYRYRKSPTLPGTVAILISQSGETMDVLACLSQLQQKGIPTLSIVNVAESSMVEESDGHLLTDAGPEIAVASTKSFTAQVFLLMILALYFGRVRKTLPSGEARRLINYLSRLPEEVEAVLALKDEIDKAAIGLSRYQRAFFLGAHAGSIVAREAALKLKEIGYLHVEGQSSADLKHGPIALIDRDVLTLVVLQDDETGDKVASSIQEVYARSGPIFLITTPKYARRLRRYTVAQLVVRTADPFTAAIQMSVISQMLAYGLGVSRGIDVDQPRNLAKSVTVE